MVSNLESHPDKKANYISLVLGIHSVPRASLRIAVNRATVSSVDVSLTGGSCFCRTVCTISCWKRRSQDEICVSNLWFCVPQAQRALPKAFNTETNQFEIIFLIPRTFCFLILFLVWELNVLLFIPFDTLGLTLYHVNWGKRLYNVVACVPKSKRVLPSVRTASYHNSHDRLWWQTGLQSAV